MPDCNEKCMFFLTFLLLGVWNWKKFIGKRRPGNQVNCA